MRMIQDQDGGCQNQLNKNKNRVAINFTREEFQDKFQIQIKLFSRLKDFKEIISKIFISMVRKVFRCIDKSPFTRITKEIKLKNLYIINVN